MIKCVTIDLNQKCLWLSLDMMEGIRKRLKRVAYLNKEFGRKKPKPFAYMSDDKWEHGPLRFWWTEAWRTPSDGSVTSYPWMFSSSCHAQTHKLSLYTGDMNSEMQFFFQGQVSGLYVFSHKSSSQFWQSGEKGQWTKPTCQITKENLALTWYFSSFLLKCSSTYLALCTVNEQFLSWWWIDRFVETVKNIFSSVLLSLSFWIHLQLPNTF